MHVGGGEQIVGQAVADLEVAGPAPGFVERVVVVLRCVERVRNPAVVFHHPERGGSLPAPRRALGDGEFQRVKPVGQRTVDDHVFHERHAAVLRGIIVKRHSSAIVGVAENSIRSRIPPRDWNVVGVERPRDVRPRDVVVIRRPPVNVRSAECETRSQAVLVTRRIFGVQRLLEVRIHDVADGAVHADEIAAVQIEVHLAWLIQLVAVEIVPGERRCLQCIPVVADSPLGAEHIPVETGRYFEHTEPASVPRQPEPGNGARPPHEIGKRVPAGGPHGREIGRCVVLLRRQIHVLVVPANAQIRGQPVGNSPRVGQVQRVFLFHVRRVHRLIGNLDLHRGPGHAVDAVEDEHVVANLRSVGRIVPGLMIVVVGEAGFELMMAAEEIRREEGVRRVDHPPVLRPQRRILRIWTGCESGLAIEAAGPERKPVLLRLTVGRIVGPPAGVTADDVEQRPGIERALVFHAVDGCGVRIVARVLQRAEHAGSVLADKLVPALPHVVHAVVARELIGELHRPLGNTGGRIRDRFVPGQIPPVGPGIGDEAGDAGVLLLLAVGAVEPELVLDDLSTEIRLIVIERLDRLDGSETLGSQMGVEVVALQGRHLVADAVGSVEVVTAGLDDRDHRDPGHSDRGVVA